MTRASTTLADEVLRYLAAVDVFRAEGCEPVWRPEREPATAPQPRRRKRQAPRPLFP